MKNIVLSLVLFFICVSVNIYNFSVWSNQSDSMLLKSNGYTIVNILPQYQKNHRLVPIGTYQNNYQSDQLTTIYHVVVLKGMELDVILEQTFASTLDSKDNDLIEYLSMTYTAISVPVMPQDQSQFSSHAFDFYEIHVTITFNDSLPKETFSYLRNGSLNYEILFKVS